MIGLDAIADFSTRRLVQGGLPVLLLGLSLTTSCTRPPEPGPTREDLWRELYTSRLENLRALDQAFNSLGQEYYKLEIEYKNSGRDDLAAVSRERAVAFQKQHLEFQKRIADLEATDARLKRGDSAVGIATKKAPAPIVTPQIQAPAAPASTAPGASAPSATPYRPPSAAGYATPARTPTPSPSGLPGAAAPATRFNDPIIITDPNAPKP